MADSSTDRSDDASPGLSTAVMRASLSQRLFDEPAPAVSIDRFRILRVVGQGAVGTVYEAYDPRLDRRLALKLVRGDLPERAQQLLLDEARTLAQVSHPNVVTVYDAGTALERVYIAMEFVSGGALVDWLDAQDRRTDEILAAFVQAGRGLVAAHGVGIVHRDFKPSNVMREEDGRVKVGDFGLARALAADSIPSMHDGSPAGSSSGTGLTTSNVAGTPAYMAPEALDGRIDPRSDQFSFCVALWEALFGKRPPAGVEALAREDALPAGGDRDVPRRVVSAVLRGLSVEPEARWPSMQALLSALESRPGSSAWRGIAVLGVGGVVGALAFDAEPEPCGVDPQALRGVWDEARRADGASAFDAHAAPYAAQTWSRVAGRLDDYVERWSDTRRRACEASLIDRERLPADPARRPRGARRSADPGRCADRGAGRDGDCRAARTGGLRGPLEASRVGPSAARSPDAGGDRRLASRAVPGALPARARAPCRGRRRVGAADRAGRRSRRPAGVGRDE